MAKKLKMPLAFKQKLAKLNPSLAKKISKFYEEGNSEGISAIIKAETGKIKDKKIKKIVKRVLVYSERIKELSAEAEKESIGGIITVMDEIKNLNLPDEVKANLDRIMLSVKGLTEKTRWYHLRSRSHYKKELRKAFNGLFKYYSKNPEIAPIIEEVSPIIEKGLEISIPIPVILLLFASFAFGMPALPLISHPRASSIAFPILLILFFIGTVVAAAGAEIGNQIVMIVGSLILTLAFLEMVIILGHEALRRPF